MVITRWTPETPWTSVYYIFSTCISWTKINTFFGAAPYWCMLQRGCVCAFVRECIWKKENGLQEFRSVSIGWQLSHHRKTDTAARFCSSAHLRWNGVWRRNPGGWMEPGSSGFAPDTWSWHCSCCVHKKRRLYNGVLSAGLGILQTQIRTHSPTRTQRYFSENLKIWYQNF